MLQRILYSFFSKGMVALINFMILLLSARYLGVRTRGEISVFLINIALVQVINEIYTGYSLVHFLQKYNNKKLLQTGLLITVLFSVIAAFILPMRWGTEVSVFSYFTMLVMVLLHSYFCVILLGKQRLRTYNFISLLQPALLLIFLVLKLFVAKDYTFQTYYFSLSASFALALPVSAFLAWKAIQSLPIFTEFSLRSVLTKGFLFQAGTLMLLFINRYTYYVLAETEKIGLYSTACALMDALLMIASAASPVLLARLIVYKEPAQLLLRILRLSLLILLVLYAGAWLLPESLVLLFVGKGYIGIRVIMLTYGPSVIFQSACILLGQYYSARGQQGQLIRLYLFPFLTHLFLAPLLISELGISGAALASGFTFLFVLLRIYMHFCRQEDLSRLFILKKFSVRSEFLELRKDY